jgi:hypothetical protein
MEDINTVHPPCCVRSRRTQHTAHAAVTASHLISCSCFPSLPQRLEFGLQPAVFASQGQRIVGSVAETTETPPAQFPVPSSNAPSLAGGMGWSIGSIFNFYPPFNKLSTAARWLKWLPESPYWKGHHFACRVWRGREILSVFLMAAEGSTSSRGLPAIL